MMKHKICMVLLMAAAIPLQAQESPAKPDFDIPKTHIEVKVIPQDEVPKPDLLPEEAKKQTSPEKPDDPMEALQQEVQTVRDELRLLQATLDLLINQIMADLREENELLRKEVQRLADLQESYGMSDPTKVPRPGIGIIREVLEAQRGLEMEGDVPSQPPILPETGEEGLDRSGTVAEEETEPATDEEAQAESRPVEFVAVQEWGRSLEMVEELGGDATSLKGIIGAVPPRSRKVDIEQLGRDLRKEYEAYDNINIEVFDDEDAARQYAETQIGKPSHRVLSISKHAASGRDVILYLGGEKAEEVAP